VPTRNEAKSILPLKASPKTWLTFGRRHAQRSVAPRRSKYLQRKAPPAAGRKVESSSIKNERLMTGHRGRIEA
jgi:hypothetical protein